MSATRIRPAIKKPTEPRNLKRRNVDVNEVAEPEEEDSYDFPMWKTVAVIVVVFACFAILYPKMFHPMILYALGMAKSEDVVINNPHPFGHERPDIPVMPGGPHPGMRMGGPHPSFKTGPAGAQPAASQSTGKGFTSMMLPVYSVGVIVFLLYTLSKIMFRKPKGIPKPKYNLQYNSNRDRFEVENQSDEEIEELIEEAAGMGNQELKSLQKRLNETESAMQKILQQLETLTSTGQPVDTDTAQSVSELTQQTLDNLSKYETYRADVGHNGAARELNRFEEKQNSPEGAAYLQDLEKALMDFKSFTDDFMVKHIQEEIAKADEIALTEDSGVDQSGFDAMESESDGLMELPPGQGEIIFLNGSGSVVKETPKIVEITEEDGQTASCSENVPVRQELAPVETIGNGDLNDGVAAEDHIVEATEDHNSSAVRQRKGRKKKPRKV